MSASELFYGLARAIENGLADFLLTARDNTSMIASLPQTVTLTPTATGDGPRFLSAQFIPARAMMLYQLRAWLPGLGEVDTLWAPPIEVGLAKMDGGADDFMGNASFSMGAAFLAPFANRVRGRYLDIEQGIETQVLGRTVVLPANGGGKPPSAERYAIHGLILNTPVDNVTMSHKGEALQAHLHAGDFGRRWLSSTDLEFSAALDTQSLSLRIKATNVGTEALPIGLGWHPYFVLPSGQRNQAHIRLPARKRLLVNDYTQVLPTGEIVSVAGTSHDFTPAGGAPLGDIYLDDCYVSIEKSPQNETICEVIDHVSAYGLRIVSSSPEISAIQTFAPPDKAFVVIEPQFNWADPFGPEWEKGTNTGMVILQPQHFVEYLVRLDIFTP